ncbi:hypothetical protein [Halovivax sp.]|uniref:hypothetical protein n=1 Tax=Halovivax sp. TaxID=1935978 RepID=UPI0025B997CA|nr:hypothetical protein [Halovivax sp.]
MPVDLEELRHRTAVVGALLLLAVSATLLLGFLDVGLEPTLAVAAVPTFAAAVALLSVRRDGDVELAGRRLGPHQRAGLGYALLAVALAIPYVPRLSLDAVGLTPLVMVAVVLSLAYQEYTGPHEPEEPSMRRIAAFIVLAMAMVVGVAVAMLVAT